MNRKDAIKTISAGSASFVLGFPAISAYGPSKNNRDQLKGNINHSACRWCYNQVPLEELCDTAKEIGMVGIDLLGEKEWKIAIDRGLTCTMTTADKFGIADGFNDPDFHKALYDNYASLIPKAADHGLKNVICLSGNRHGLSDEEGLDNCAKGLEKVVKIAEENNIILTMELLNSKVDHADYQCDHTDWGVRLCKKVGSNNFKLLYDIYHMQIMEGDVIATIKKNHQYIGHYHTGGVPGRHEIDQRQELYYPAIMKTIVDTGFKGFVAQEFVPTAPNPLDSLKEAIEICDV